MRWAVRSLGKSPGFTVGRCSRWRFETGVLARYELAPRSPGIFAGASVVGDVSVLPWIVDRDIRRGVWSEYAAVGPLLALELTFPHVRAFLELKKPLFSEQRLRDYHVMVQLGVGGFFEL